MKHRPRRRQRDARRAQAARRRPRACADGGRRAFVALRAADRARAPDYVIYDDVVVRRRPGARRPGASFLRMPRASRRSARSATPTPTPRRWTPSASTGPTRSSSRRCPRRLRAGCGATSSSASRRRPELPVEHVVTDIDAEGLPFDVTLVVANQTASGDELLDKLREKAGDDAAQPPVRHRRARRTAAAAVRARAGPHAASGWCWAVSQTSGLLAAGMIGDPDPYTATMNALQFFRVDDIVISTLPGDQLGLAARRPDRARAQAPRASTSSTSSRHRPGDRPPAQS